MTFSFGTYTEKATFPHTMTKGKRSPMAEAEFDVSEASEGEDMLTQCVGSEAG